MQGIMPGSEFAIEFAGKTVQWAQAELDLTAHEVAQAIGANRKTIVRWRLCGACGLKLGGMSKIRFRVFSAPA